MSIPKFNSRTLSLLLMMAAVAAFRVILTLTDQLSPIAVFTPLGAMALFGGAYFTGRSKPLAFAFPLLTLFISDLVLSCTVYSSMRTGLLYAGWYWVYGAFALMTLAGSWLLKRVSAKNILIAAISITLIHWLLSDIGGCILDTGKQGMASVYIGRLITAIPFEWRFFTGTMVYSAILFGSFEWMKKTHPALAM